MSKNSDELYGKTFDQQLQSAGKDVEKKDISPNRRIPGEIVFEPVLNGVRVSARDGEHRTLWAFIGSKGMLHQHPCPVAIYDALVDLIIEELEKNSLPIPETGDPLEEAQNALKNLQKSLKQMNDSLEVRKVSEATKERARVISHVARNAEK